MRRGGEDDSLAVGDEGDEEAHMGQHDALPVSSLGACSRSSRLALAQ
jgi:hypothetical protein